VLICWDKILTQSFCVLFRDGRSGVKVVRSFRSSWAAADANDSDWCRLTGAASSSYCLAQDHVVTSAAPWAVFKSNFCSLELASSLFCLCARPIADTDSVLFVLKSVVLANCPPSSHSPHKALAINWSLDLLSPGGCLEPVLEIVVSAVPPSECSVCACQCVCVYARNATVYVCCVKFSNSRLQAGQCHPSHTSRRRRQDGLLLAGQGRLNTGHTVL